MKGTPYKYFFAISLFFGLMYIFIIPPFQAPDEDSHLFRCYEIFNSNLTSQDDPSDRLGGYLPASLFQYSDQFRYLRFNYEERITSQQLSSFNEKKLDKVNIEFTDFSNTAMYFPTSYPLQSITAGVASLLNLRPATILYLLRFSSLLIWLVTMHFAFKFFPGTNQLFLFMALMPSILVLHSSISADVITNSLSFLLVAYVFKLREQEANIAINQMLFFGLVILIITINKIVYFPLILLWFFLPFGKFDTAVKYFGVFSAIAFICILLTSIWSLKVNEAYITYENYNPAFRADQQIKPNGNPVKQMEYILSKPLAFTGNVIKSYLSVVPATAAHLTGKFGWGKNYMPSWMIAILVLSLIFLILNNSFSLALKDRLLFLCIIISSLYLLAIVMYGIYSAVANDYIHNLGGKYLLPLFPILTFVCSVKLLKFKIDTKWLFLVIILSHMLMVYSILNRYYF